MMRESKTVWSWATRVSSRSRAATRAATSESTNALMAPRIGWMAAFVLLKAMARALSAAEMVGAASRVKSGAGVKPPITTGGRDRIVEEIMFSWLVMFEDRILRAVAISPTGERLTMGESSEATKGLERLRTWWISVF